MREGTNPMTHFLRGVCLRKRNGGLYQLALVAHIFIFVKGIECVDMSPYLISQKHTVISLKYNEEYVIPLDFVDYIINVL